MDLNLLSKDNNKENSVLSQLKKEETITKDLLNKYTQVKIDSGKKVFIPLIKHSKIGFFEAEIKAKANCFTNIGEYVIESSIDSKIKKLNKSILLIKDKIKDFANKKNNQKKSLEDITIYDEKKVKVGELKKLNEDIFEIVEHENISDKDKNDLEKINERDILDINEEEEVIRKLEEIKNSRSKLLDPSYISFADLEYL